jgi:hypothetical protein
LRICTAKHICGALTGALLALSVSSARADETEYHTPLAGEAYRAEVGGKTILVPARDRDDVRSITLGGAYFTPRLGDEWGSPFGALYWKRHTGRWRSRAVVGLFVNELDLAREFGQFELLGHVDNKTIPFPTAEIIDGKEVRSTSIIQGSITGSVGVGYRVPVAPFQSDNAFRLRLLYNAGYLYTGRVAETGADVRLPPSTFVQGFQFRADCDTIRRNIMELPHEGWASGVDVEVGRRDHWSDHTLGGTVFRRDKTRDFLKLSAFFTGVAPLPGLSERHRLVGILHGGFAPADNIDRFSAFRIGGGPYPSETDDLYRYWYPGALFDQFPASDFVVGSLEYRYELFFFLYLHFRGTMAEVNRPYVKQDSLTISHLDFIHDYSGALSLGVTSGLPWDSQLYAEYTYDARILRHGVPGSSLLLLWSKAF